MNRPYMEFEVANSNTTLSKRVKLGVLSFHVLLLTL